jgi:anti-sigma factor RsiW
VRPDRRLGAFATAADEGQRGAGVSERGGWTISPLPEAHLLPDAVVAYVDGELSPTAHDRAAAHIARCPVCAHDTCVQRQARDAVQTAEAPRMPAGLLAALRAIPTDTDLPEGVDRLAVTPEGDLVAVQRPDRVAFGTGPVLGSSSPLGTGGVLRAGGTHGRRAMHGAGAVAAGLMLGALAVVGPHVFGATSQSPSEQPHDNGTTGGNRLVQANVGGPLHDGVAAAQLLTSATPVTPTPSADAAIKAH